MKERIKKYNIKRYLTFSFIAILLFSILSFSFLGIYMSRKSHEAFQKIGRIYMSGMSEQISGHFESVIQLRFDQVQGLVSVVPSHGQQNQELYEELSYRAEVRGFGYLGLCGADGTFEMLLGEQVSPRNPQPFVQALIDKQNRVAIGVDESGREVVLFGVDASYPMSDGRKSTGLVAAVPLTYITDFLSLDKDNLMMSYFIIRDDGSIVIDDSHLELGDTSERFSALLEPYDASDGAYCAEEFEAALAEDRSYAATVSIGGEEHMLQSVPMPHSEWNLISIMPYNQLNGVLDTLNVQRTKVTVLSCLSVLLFMILIFIGYFSMTNAQLRELEKSRRAATEANRAKSEFLANMSHDIRTPMNAIVGMTAIASAHIDDQQQVASCLRKIALSSKQLLGLINDVLDLSKIESGHMTLTAEKTSLKDLLDGVISIMQPQMQSRKQSFDVHTQNIETETVWCDGVRLNQVLLNLLSNATKYTPEGGSIWLRLSEEDSPKGDSFVRVHIFIKDSGIGMTPEFLTKLYESYSRADSRRVQKTEGAGLGMAITRYIVDAMEGSIDVASEPERGTEFHLVFDFEKAGAPDADMTLPPWKMLVVDDDEAFCKAAIETLQTLGIHAEWTLSGESAIEQALARHLSGEDYQIILLDWKLPGMDGIRTAKELRSNLGAELPILLISAYDWSEWEKEARDAGVNGFLSKPLFKSTLYYRLREYLMDEEGTPKETQKQEAELTGRRILLAEDNELNWEIARELLSDLGLTLEWAEDGRVCLEKFEHAPAGYYDLILMDIRMPHMTGYEAAEAIRKSGHPDAATIPIIAMSADAFAEDIQHCLDSGMNDHTAKPIDMVKITKLLKKYLT